MLDVSHINVLEKNCVHTCTHTQSSNSLSTHNLHFEQKIKAGLNHKIPHTMANDQFQTDSQVNTLAEAPHIPGHTCRHTCRHRQTDRQTDRQTERQKDRQTCRHASKQASRKTDTHTHNLICLIKIWVRNCTSALGCGF